MTIKEALHTAEHQLTHLSQANILIYILLSHSLELSKEYIWAHPDTIITHHQFERFWTSIQRAANHEPHEYIIGEKEFYGIPFYVTRDVLIPRPESESIIDRANEFIKNFNIEPGSRLTIIDVGTGSGCLAITLARLYPHADVYAIDVSTKALEVAKRNAVRHHVSNITFLQGSLLKPLQAARHDLSPDLIVANLPYISDNEFTSLPLNVKQFEPEAALRSGSDPDRLNHQLITQAKEWLSPAGKLIYETTNGRVIQLNATDLI